MLTSRAQENLWIINSKRKASNPINEFLAFPEYLYNQARTYVTEEGGILNHASVVCREIDKPCCIGVKDATRILKDGQRVKVNATNGEIVIIG